MATKHQEMLTLEGAKIAVAASENKAREIGVDMNIAVVDASTHLLHFSRMPNAKITSISSMWFGSVRLFLGCFEELFARFPWMSFIHYPYQYLGIGMGSRVLQLLN
jgi:hypothetical protein